MVMHLPARIALPLRAVPVPAVLAIALPALAENPIPFPHPQITEVLFNVPAKDDADPNADGKRDAAGDEFIELANPHNQPISLKGYVITNRRASVTGKTDAGVRFVFPDVQLPPHGVCVVFNGYQAAIPAPVGDAAAPPPGGNAQFNNVMVFSMKITKKGTSFANTGDWVLLSAPDGSPIDAVVWGEPSPAPPADALRLERVEPAVKGSVQRLRPDSALEPHTAINGESYSPGVIPKRTQPAPVQPASRP